LDHDLDDDDKWFDAVSVLPPDGPGQSIFDEYGELRPLLFVNEHRIPTSDHENHVIPTKGLLLEVFERDQERQVTTKEPDYHQLRPNFGWLPIDTIRKTLQNTTQMAKMPMSDHLRKQYKAPNPALNVTRRQEALATDTVYSDTPAVDSGVTSAQFYVGVDTLVCNTYGMKSDKQFVQILMDNIRRHGAPTRLLSDRAQVEISNKVQDVLQPFLAGKSKQIEWLQAFFLVNDDIID
jgi:hypothetical protein